jgi:hypothetical protein
MHVIGEKDQTQILYHQLQLVLNHWRGVLSCKSEEWHGRIADGFGERVQEVTGSVSEK